MTEQPAPSADFEPSVKIQTASRCVSLCSKNFVLSSNGVELFLLPQTGQILRTGLRQGGNFEGLISSTQEGSIPDSRALFANRTSRGFGSLGRVGALSVGCFANL